MDYKLLFVCMHFKIVILIGLPGIINRQIENLRLLQTADATSNATTSSYSSERPQAVKFD